MRNKLESDELPKRYYEALGRILVAFQALEGEITYALIKLSQPQRDSEIEIQFLLALESMPFKNRVKLLRSFAATRQLSYYLWPNCPEEKKRKKELPSILKAFRENILEAEKLENERNALVHSEWHPHRSEKSVAATRHKVKLRNNGTCLVKEKVPIEHLLHLVERMQTARKSISGISQFLSWMLKEKQTKA